MNPAPTQRGEAPLTAQVAVAAQVAGFLSYLVPPELAGAVQVGQAVLAPLGSRPAVGYILALERTPPLARLKPLMEIIGPEPLFGPGLSRLIHFISSYYHYPLGQTAKEILPGGLGPALTRVLRLAEDAAPSPFLLGAEAELLNLLKAAAGKGLDFKKVSAGGFGLAARRLTSSGQARPGWRLDFKTAEIRTEWWLAPAEEPEPRRLGPREAALWRLVREGPAKPLSYFAHYVPRPLTQARSLAAKGLIKLYEVFRDNPARGLTPAGQGPPPDLMPQQARALAALDKALTAREGREFLLFGVTGSGKTEVYLRAAAAALAAGREVLWLTPEIGLTLGLERLLKSRLGEGRVAVLHSGLSAAQRHDQWLRIHRGLTPVVLGARSAVFAPLENLGLVVVD